MSRRKHGGKIVHLLRPWGKVCGKKRGQESTRESDVTCVECARIYAEQQQRAHDEAVERAEVARRCEKGGVSV